MARLPDNLPKILRDAGLKVVAVNGWRERGRPSGGFDPVGVLCHHTATSQATSNTNVVNLLVRGRSDLPGPLCQLGLARDGTVYIIAAGRANHAGTAKAAGSVAAGDGNYLYIGIEAFNDGVGEPWPAVQYDAYVTLAATLCREVTGNSAETVHGHKETSVTGKIDPRFDMDAFRREVAEQIKTPRTSQEDDMFTDADRETLNRIEDMTRTKLTRVNTRLARANGLLRELRSRKTITPADLDAAVGELEAALSEAGDGDTRA